TSPKNHGLPLPSMSWPFWISRSWDTGVPFVVKLGERTPPPAPSLPDRFTPSTGGPTGRHERGRATAGGRGGRGAGGGSPEPRPAATARQLCADSESSAGRCASRPPERGRPPPPSAVLLHRPTPRPAGSCHPPAGRVGHGARRHSAADSHASPTGGTHRSGRH